MALSKLQFDGTDRQLQDFLKDFLVRECKGQEHDAISAANRLQERYGLRADWHLLQYALDAVERCGQAAITKPGGFTRYIIH